MEQSVDSKKSQIDNSIIDVTSPDNRRVVSFKSHSSIEFTLEVSPVDTITSLKQQITKKARVPLDKLAVYFPEINNDHS